MATAHQNVYINTSLNAAKTNQEEEFPEYDEITYVKTKDSSNDGNTTIPNIPLPRQADIHGRHVMQISLWWLFPIIICFVFAIVITGVVTFFITKERFTEQHMSVCDSNPSVNGGRCQLNGADYKCTCNPGFSGDQCEMSVCDSNPCNNGGRCQVNGTDYKCTCIPGFSGDQCKDIGYSDYVIMFTEPPYHFYHPRLYMHSSTKGIVSIYTKRNGTRTVDLSSGTNHFNLSYSISTTDGISNKAVHINSTVPILLYGFVGGLGKDGYLALPSAMLGNKYIVPTFKPLKFDNISKSLIGVISLKADTQVHIKMRIPRHGTKVRYNAVLYGNGEILSVTLSEFQTFQISHIYDLSGSVVTSNKPVGVVSGNKCNSINQYYCNVFIEMVLPVNQLEKQFIIPTIAKRNDSVIRVFCHDNTEIKISTVSRKYSVNVKKENFYEFNNSHLASISTNSNALVVSFPKDISNYDAFMMTIPGIKHYKSYYNFTVPSRYTSYLSVTYLVTNVKSRYDPLNGFIIDKNLLHITDVYKNTINEQVFTTFSHGIEDGAHEIRHELDMKFGLWIYGDKGNSGYGFPGDMTYTNQP
ncbi:unnamed protein product [Mytilus coruscus]|uniref:EGF-like domain-containing protein n=1 Tax=Mytilus coruscus TaxID=42192 RepID=A0A6J8CGS9_MYTCO|nr:unnamed protein product [Mytilus coruscus]